jgi:hypothetical protein
MAITSAIFTGIIIHYDNEKNSDKTFLHNTGFYQPIHTVP